MNQTSLDPYEVMWVKYIKNGICGFECRTTSVTESMHYSMKSEYESAQSNFSLHKLANIMLDKSNYTHKNTYRLSAKSVNSYRSKFQR